ncbi:MAG: tRNA (N1-methyl-G37)-methyltransferase [Candidatus Parcubacteria bacterium]|jgi:tRNA (guanine37-N1)-methyltransferase
MRFDVLTIFPRIFDSYLNESLFKRAIRNGIVDIRIHNLRDFSSDTKHHKVDDKPFGGGPGMVMQVGPIDKAIRAIRRTKGKERIILFSTRGKKLDAKTVRRLSRYDRLVLICGRYEGVDERVATHIADEEISVGEYVLSGGEIPALALMEAVSRFVPGFLGKYESLEDVKGSYPVYSRPEVFSPKRGTRWSVPKALMSGDHKRIAAWRRQT